MSYSSSDADVVVISSETAASNGSAWTVPDDVLKLAKKQVMEHFSQQPPRSPGPKRSQEVKKDDEDDDDIVIISENIRKRPNKVVPIALSSERQAEIVAAMRQSGQRGNISVDVEGESLLGVFGKKNRISKCSIIVSGGGGTPSKKRRREFGTPIPIAPPEQKSPQLSTSLPAEIRRSSSERENAPAANGMITHSKTELAVPLPPPPPPRLSRKSLDSRKDTASTEVSTAKILLPNATDDEKVGSDRLRDLLRAHPVLADKNVNYLSVSLLRQIYAGDQNFTFLNINDIAVKSGPGVIHFVYSGWTISHVSFLAAYHIALRLGKKPQYFFDYVSKAALEGSCKKRNDTAPASQAKKKTTPVVKRKSLTSKEQAKATGVKSNSNSKSVGRETDKSTILVTSPTVGSNKDASKRKNPGAARKFAQPVPSAPSKNGHQPPRSRSKGEAKRLRTKLSTDSSKGGAVTKGLDLSALPESLPASLEPCWFVNKLLTLRHVVDEETRTVSERKEESADELKSILVEDYTKNDKPSNKCSLGGLRVQFSCGLASIQDLSEWKEASAGQIGRYEDILARRNLKQKKEVAKRVEARLKTGDYGRKDFCWPSAYHKLIAGEGQAAIYRDNRTGEKFSDLASVWRSQTTMCDEEMKQIITDECQID